MVYETLITEKANGVGTITINRPEMANAFATATYQEIADAIEAFDADPEVNAIVITGAGKHFSAGGDIKRFKELIDSGEYLQVDSILTACRMPKTIRACSKPTIAMVNGVATGAGLSCALACDYRIVDAKSTMIMAFSNLGLCGDNGGTYMLAKLVGAQKAGLMMMTGDPVGGEKAVEMGLATICAEEGTLKETAYKLAEKLAKRSHVALAAQKKLLNAYNFGELQSAFEDEAKLMRECSLQPDFAEAVNAFLEKRPAEFNKPR